MVDISRDLLDWPLRAGGSPLPALLLISAFLAVAVIIAQFTSRAGNRSLEVLSPWPGFSALSGRSHRAADRRAGPPVVARRR